MAKEEYCRQCEQPFTGDNRNVYANLCLKCYRESKLPCDRCQKPMVPETHRTTKGLCFDCFFPAAGEAEEVDRESLIHELIAEVPQSLPDEYLSFLREHDGHQRYSHRKQQGKEWYLASVVAEHSPCLTGACLIDNQTPFHRILSLYASQLQEAQQSGNVPIDASVSKFGFERLACGIAIGDENADILFLDPSENHSLWCFYHDGELKRLADSFGDWFTKTKKAYKPPKQTAKSLVRKIPEYAGYWAPVTQPNRVISHLPIVHYEFLEDGRARCIYIDRENGDRSESYGTWRLFGKDKLGYQTDDEAVLLRLPDGNLRTDYDPDLDVVLGRQAESPTGADPD